MLHGLSEKQVRAIKDSSVFRSQVDQFHDALSYVLAFCRDYQKKLKKKDENIKIQFDEIKIQKEFLTVSSALLVQHPDMTFVFRYRRLVLTRMLLQNSILPQTKIEDRCDQIKNLKWQLLNS